jgi:guanylate kinase
MLKPKTKLDSEIEKQKKRGILIVISGPTCAGKDSVVRELVKDNKNAIRLVTTNSRPKRPDEKEGVDYYFISRQEFEEKINKGDFFEWVEYRGDYRGTQKKHIEEALKSGKDVLWRIDVRGVKNINQKVKKEYPYSAFIFLAEDLQVLENRMKKRATEKQKWQEWSLQRAVWEMNQYRDFDYVVLNEEGKLNEAVKNIKMIIEAERRRVR